MDADTPVETEPSIEETDQFNSNAELPEHTMNNVTADEIDQSMETTEHFEVEVDQVDGIDMNEIDQYVDGHNPQNELYDLVNEHVGNCTNIFSSFHENMSMKLARSRETMMEVRIICIYISKKISY